MVCSGPHSLLTVGTFNSQNDQFNLHQLKQIAYPEDPEINTHERTLPKER